MKILLCHDYYQQPGGEDQVFADETWLLESHGHDVVRFTVHNDSIDAMSSLAVARRTIWNERVYDRLCEVIRRERPTVMHCTNTFPLISPAAYYAARAEGVAVVQSLHNYRLLCPNALFLRGGRVCEDCSGKRVAWPGAVHACYRQDRAASAVVVAMLAIHRAIETWTRVVNQYIALTAFARAKFIEGGVPADRIAVKPNFVHPDPGFGAGRGDYAVFAGRLSPEKGVETLLAAWTMLKLPIALKILGDGPLADRVKAAVQRDSRIEWLGRRPLDQVLAIIGDAACLIMPSIWYETFGRTIVESFAKGTPVIGSRLGAVAELIEHGRTGLHFEPGNARDLADNILALLRDPSVHAGMRRAARACFEEKYTAEPNYERLMAIYRQAIAVSLRDPRAAAAPRRLFRPLLRWITAGSGTPDGRAPAHGAGQLETCWTGDQDLNRPDSASGSTQ